jgi:hypothetical protein
MSKKNHYIACLETGGERRIHFFKSVSINNLKRTIKRNKPDSVIISIYPEPHLFNKNDDYDVGTN